MLKHRLIWLAWAILPLCGMAQNADWVSMMHNPDARFEDVVAAANAYFDAVGTGKGTGWKAFKRWEYYMERRVDKSGRMTVPANVLTEITAYYNAHPEFKTQRRNSTSGSWVELGPVPLPTNGTGQPNGLGRITAIAFHPTLPQTIYAGTPAGGFWVTEDYGLTWDVHSTGLTELGISTIVVHPTTPNIIYIGTGDRDGGDTPGYGVWRSTDAGMTWAPRNTGMGNRVCYEILMDPVDPNILICATSGNIWRSVNGGANWTNVYNGGEDFKDLAFMPGNSNVVYAASNDFYRSANNGVTWGQVTSGVPTTASRFALATTTANPNYLYMIGGSGSGFVGIYRSTDAGLNFSLRANTPNLMGYDVTGGTGSQAWYDLVMIGDPGNADHITMGAINVWESFNGGTNWSIVTHWTGGGGNPAVHADQHVLEHSPSTGHLWLGCDGGVYYSTNAGNTWIDRSAGLGIAQVYKIGQSQTVKDLVINGYQDNGTGIYRGTSGWWTEIGGDGMECIIDPTDANYMYGALYYGDIRRSTNNGISFSTISGTIPEDGAWVTPYVLQPGNPNTMLVGMINMFRSTNVKAGTPTWTQISTLPGTNTVRDIAIAPSNTDVVYISRSGTANFYRSNNANAGTPTWTDLDAFLPTSGFPADIEIDPTDPAHLWIALGNNIYESLNSGGSWTDVSGTLPNIPLNTIVYDRRSVNDALYVGMDVGVYYRDASMANWVPFSAGLPNVEVAELEIYYDPLCPGKDMLRAATYGRGLWESDLRDPGNVPPIACFEALPTTACVGQSVTFTDWSAYNPTGWTWTASPATVTFVGGTNANSQNPVIQFNVPGTYTITLQATNGSGADTEVLTNYITVSGTGMLLPITEDFEAGPLCATTNNCGTQVCALPGGWTNDANVTVDNHDWRISEGSTPTTGTGPDVDANPGTATGNYAYLEASSCNNQTAQMVSPCIDLRTAVNPELIFAYHLFGTQMGSLHVDLQNGLGWNLDIVAPLSGNIGNVWQDLTVSLAPFVGEVVRIRFRGITGTGSSSDMAIDNLRLREGSPLAAAGIVLSGEYVAGRGNMLEWMQSADVEGTHYILERRSPETSFTEIYRTYLRPGPGAYTRRDGYPFQGRNIYRLRLVDAEGRIQEAGQVEVVSDWAGVSLLVYPNPSKGIFQVQIQNPEAGEGTLQVFDLAGQEVHRQVIVHRGGLQQFDVALEGLGAGVYLLRYKGLNRRIVIQP